MQNFCLGLCVLATTACTDDFGASCETDSDCPSGWKCLYWPRARTTGVCEPSCPVAFDALAIQGGVCGCDGVRRALGCTDYPWSHLGLSDDDRDAGQSLDTLLVPGTSCTPDSICESR